MAERHNLRSGIRTDPEGRTASCQGGSLGNIGRDIVITEGSAGRVRDASGNEYIDFLLGSGPMLIGHAHPEVIEVVRQQIEKGTTFFANNDQAIMLAEELVNAVACADKVRFTSSGTEATFYALRTARAYRQRDKIVKFEGGFHGMHDYALMSMSPANPHDFPRPTPDSAGIPRAIEDEVLIAPFNDIETATSIIEANHDDLGAVIVEPFQRLLPPAPGFSPGSSRRNGTIRHPADIRRGSNRLSFRLRRSPGILRCRA